jgi:ubiquinone/menaquinone biosynthesis C-methylase UbiE
MDRPSLQYKLLKALRSPSRIVPYFLRKYRNLIISTQSKSPLEFYASVVDANSETNPELAVGSSTPEHWITLGDMQIAYLVKHGLMPTDMLLDFGCGNLRAGRRLIEYLNVAHYTGIDISPNILKAGIQTIAKFNLQAKRPYVYLVSDNSLSLFQDSSFNVIQAHSVFSHMPMGAIKEALSSCFRVLKPGGFFDFTYFEIENGYKQFLNEDFYYTREAMLAAVRDAGLYPEFMDDWVYVQNKIRAHKH